MSKLKFIFFIFVSNILLVAQQESVAIRITSEPKSYCVFINDEFEGNTPLTINLPVGRYNLKLATSKFGWNSVVKSDSITINPTTENTQLHYKIEDKFILSTLPTDAKVFVNDSLYAHTPIEIPRSILELKLSKPGFIDEKIDIKKYQSGISIPLKSLGLQKKEQFVDSPWFKVLLGSTIVLGATAAYFKIQADQKYDEYLSKRDNKILDDVDRYDLYSGISFSILQINFGILIYNFLFEGPSE